MRLANAIRTVTGCDDLNIVVNSGAAAGQDEPHYHVHIIPRRAGDGFDIPLPFNGSQMPDRTVLDAYAVRIISALRDPVRIESRKGAAALVAPRRAGKGMHSERLVERQIFNEARQPQAGVQRWPVEEGAHGELLVDW
jgi:hypothetical protein